MSITCKQVFQKTPAEVALVAVDLRPCLDVDDSDPTQDEVATGMPTVAELTSTDLTIDQKAVSTEALVIRGETVATGKAVQFRVAGGTTGGGQNYADPRPGGTRITAYAILVTFTTAKQTRQLIVLVECIAATP